MGILRLSNFNDRGKTARTNIEEMKALQIEACKTSDVLIYLCIYLTRSYSRNIMVTVSRKGRTQLRLVDKLFMLFIRQPATK